MQTPASLGLQYREITLRDAGQPDLVGWFIPAVQEPVIATVVFLHGNAENISTHLNSVYWLPAHGFNLLMVEYRGYGASQGKAEIAGVHEDARRFLRYAVRTNKLDVPLVLYGQSLGASIGLYVASENEFPLALVISESGFKGYQSMALDALRPLNLFRYLFSPFTLFVSNAYAPERTVADINARVLFIHGTEDKTIPASHSEALHKQIPLSEYWPVENRGHLEIFSAANKRAELVHYIQAVIEQ